MYIRFSTMENDKLIVTGDAGNCWAAIDENGDAIATISMGGCPMIKKADKRYRAGYRYVSGNFKKYRQEARDTLAGLSDTVRVASGVKSGISFHEN